jgi:galactokinase
MTSEARAALREKVVKALDETFRQAQRRGMWNVSREYDCAVAAIDVALEEAARVAESRGQLPSTGDRVHDAGWDGACISIAAAIRGLITSPESAAPPEDQPPAIR